MDKAHQIAPVEALLNRGDGALTNRRPDAPQEWLEPNAMFVGGPQFDLGMGIRRGDCLQQWPQLFLKVSCCSASASACRGRGAC